MRHARSAWPLGLGLFLACGPQTSSAWQQQVASATEMLEEGGNSPFKARLAFLAPEAMAIQEVPYSQDREASARFSRALAKYRSQWTFVLSIGPKETPARSQGLLPGGLDIESNGGPWGDHSRNLQRLMFEMGAFIRLVTPDGRALEPAIVEFQRSFGLGVERSFVMAFPKEHQGKSVVPPFSVVIREFGQGMGVLRFEVKKAPSPASGWRVRRMWEASSTKG